MSELPRRIAELLEGGGFAVMVPLFVCCAWLWIILIERMSAIGPPPWASIVPSLRRKAANEHHAIRDAFDSYAETPSRKHREALLSICRAQPGPYSLFLRRALAGAQQSQQAPPRRLLQCRVLEASLAAEHESEKGLALVPALTRSALLLGLLGTVAGLEGMFREMAGSGPGDPSTWKSGVSMALMCGETGLAVALSGLAGWGWLSTRASAIADEIRSSRLRLRGIGSRPDLEVLP